MSNLSLVDIFTFFLCLLKMPDYDMDVATYNPEGKIL